MTKTPGFAERFASAFHKAMKAEHEEGYDPKTDPMAGTVVDVDDDAMFDSMPEEVPPPKS